MRRLAALLLLFALSLGLFSGCGNAPKTEAAGGPSVVATIFPLYDWTKKLAGDAPLSLTLLLDSGTDMHSYQPSVEDIAKISACDLLIYVGGESDAWVSDALNNAVNPKLTALNLMEILGDAAKTEETVEGMQAEAEEEAAYDEHIWLSLKNAEICCRAIEKALAALDAESAPAFETNLAALLERLDALDAAYREAVAPALLRSSRPAVLVFADRFPFRYLLDDYQIGYYAAFPGCEAETEASFETVAFLARKTDELGVPAILTTESPVPRLAETVLENTAAKTAAILALDSMQSVTAEEIASGADYLGIMEKNLDVLKEALK